MRTLAREIDGLELPAVEKISESQKDDPFQILISTLLSARTQDATTLAASTRLFADGATRRQPSPGCRVSQIEKLIYPVGFYRNKAVFVRDAAQMIVDAVRRPVPATLEEMITLPGVGRKTANLVMILAFKSRENICVDIHVHRISNRLGWVRTRHARADRAGALPAPCRGSGGRWSICIWSPGARICAVRCILVVGDCAHRHDVPAGWSAQVGKVRLM